MSSLGILVGGGVIMQTHRLKIIQATYKQRQHDTLVELYGRTDTGQSITVLYEGFYPYCYMEAVPGALEVVRRNGAVAPKVLWDRLEDVELVHDQKTIKCHKITVMHPSVVKKIRDQFNTVNVLLSSGVNLDRLPQFFSADIKFGIRFMYDLDLGSCIEVMGKPYEEEHPYTTELVILADIVAPAEDFQVNFSILSYDIEASMSTKTMLCNCFWIRRSDGTEVEYRLIGTEKEMLKEFQKIIIEEDPDVITGYNIDGFDNPYLNDRHESNYLPRLKIGRNGTAWRSRDVKESKMWFVTGRIIADAMYMARKFKKPRRETLQYVSQMLLGESKLDVNAAMIDEEWKADKLKVLDYCSKDAYLALRIIDKLNVLDYYSNLAAVGMVPLTTVYSGATSPLIDSHVVREFEKAGFAVPVGSKPDPDYKKIQGATVVEPEPGVHNWVVVVDYKALYPTTIMVHNMCPTTLDMENGTIVSPVGAKFLPPEVRKGIIPKVIKRLQDMRNEYKAKMWVEDPDNPGEKIESPMHGFYNGLQNAVKVISNAMYGILTATFYRFFKKIIGASITAYARAALDRIIQWIRKMNLSLVAGDTDSCFVRSPWPNLNGCITLGNMLSNQFTADGYELEFEKVLNPWFTHGAKKRYFAHVVWDDGKILLDDPDVYSRGYEIRRTDSFDYCLDSLEELLQAVCTEGAETAVSLAKERVKMIYEGSVSAEQIAYSKRCKPEAEYKKPESQVQVRVARMLKAMGHRFTPWMKVSFIYTDGDKSPKQAYPFIDGEKFPHTPDWDYYAVRMAEVLGRVTDVFGCDAGALLQYAKGQTSLDSYGVIA